jgi:hypothetical protein
MAPQAGGDTVALLSCLPLACIYTRTRAQQLWQPGRPGPGAPARQSTPAHLPFQVILAHFIYYRDQCRRRPGRGDQRGRRASKVAPEASPPASGFGSDVTGAGRRLSRANLWGRCLRGAPPAPEPHTGTGSVQWPGRIRLAILGPCQPQSKCSGGSHLHWQRKRRCLRICYI